jgi:hypothetical protein
VNLPSDRTKEGSMTLTVNGEIIELGGGNQALGKGTTNKGKNPRRDFCKEFGDTPTGEATVTTYAADRDEEGEFATTDGIPKENRDAKPGSQLKSQGRYFILLNPESGDLLKSGRTEIGIHGGGSVLGDKALQSQQDLVGTKGCVRVTNQTAAQIAKQVTNAIQNNRVFRVIITKQE